jgi:hypothetical protein
METPRLPDNDDRQRDSVVVELTSKLHARGVELTGTETSDEVGDLLDAVEDWEAVVERQGGDLYVDEGGDQPDNPDFVLPKRRAGERVADYIQRIAQVTDLLRHGGHPPQ